METKIIEILAYTIPSIITGAVAYFLFKTHFEDQQNTRKWLIQKDARKDALPMRLQAYERMTLFLERINVTKLMVRIAPVSEKSDDYENYVIAQIDQEFEHNLTQQIYISNECWNVVLAAKNATIQLIRVVNRNEKITTADRLREAVLNEMMDNPSPSAVALEYIKNEVAMLW